MEENNVLENLNENLKSLNDVENEIAMVELAIFQKNIENIKNNKLNEVRQLFEQKARLYNQKSENCKDKIESNIEKYKVQIEKIIELYENLYVTIFGIMQNAVNNQKIAIGNIVSLTQQLKNKELNDMDKEKIQETIIALAQKKINYSVIVEECKARIKWCIQISEDDLNEIFENNINQLQKRNESILIKIKTKLFNLLNGKKEYKNFVENYESKYLSKIKQKNNYKILEVVAYTKAINKQMIETKKQINVKYNEMVTL